MVDIIMEQWQWEIMCTWWVDIRGFGESRFFRMGGVPPVFFYLYGYRINLEKELALYLYALCESLKSYMIKSKYIKL